MTALRQRMIEDMQVRGLSPKTQQSYVRVVQQLAQHSGKAPDQLTEDELRHYFLYLRTEKRVSRSTMTIALCAIKFLYQYTLQRPWPLHDLIRPPKETKLVVRISILQLVSPAGWCKLCRFFFPPSTPHQSLDTPFAPPQPAWLTAIVVAR